MSARTLFVFAPLPLLSSIDTVAIKEEIDQLAENEELVVIACRNSADFIETPIALLRLFRNFRSQLRSQPLALSQSPAFSQSSARAQSPALNQSPVQQLTHSHNPGFLEAPLAYGETLCVSESHSSGGLRSQLYPEPQVQLPGHLNIPSGRGRSTSLGQTPHRALSVDGGLGREPPGISPDCYIPKHSRVQSMKWDRRLPASQMPSIPCPSELMCTPVARMSVTQSAESPSDIFPSTSLPRMGTGDKSRLQQTPSDYAAIDLTNGLPEDLSSEPSSSSTLPSSATTESSEIHPGQSPDDIASLIASSDVKAIHIPRTIAQTSLSTLYLQLWTIVADRYRIQLSHNLLR